MMLDNSGNIGIPLAVLAWGEAALPAAVNLLGLQVWAPLLTALKMLGDIAIPLLLFALGVRMLPLVMAAVP